MNPLDSIAYLREQGARPDSVSVALVPGKPMRATIHRGSVAVDVPAAASLADIDWRPLVGLKVLLIDLAGDERRHRRAAKLIAEALPASLVTFFGDTLHRFVSTPDGAGWRKGIAL